MMIKRTKKSKNSFLMSLFSDGFVFSFNTWKMNWRVIWRRWWVIWTAWWRWWLLLLLFIYFFQSSWNHTHFLYWLVVHIIPPFVLPVCCLVLSLHAKAQTIFSSLDLNTIFCSLLLFAKTISLLPSHLTHQLFCVFTLKLSVWNSWRLQKSLSVFVCHMFSTIKNDYKFNKKISIYCSSFIF